MAKEEHNEQIQQDPENAEKKWPSIGTFVFFIMGKVRRRENVPHSLSHQNFVLMHILLCFRYGWFMG